MPDSTLIVICFSFTLLPNSICSPTENRTGSLKNITTVSLDAPAVTETISPFAPEVLPTTILPGTKSLLFGWF